MLSPCEISLSYKHCPVCGVKRVSFEPARPFRCHACGHTCFFGPVTAVGGIIQNQKGEVLLLERARDPGAGKLGMPGGFVDPYETAEASLHREVLEEVGLSIHSVRFVMTFPNRYTYQNITNPVLDIFFTARVDEGAAISAEAAEVAGWMWTAITDEVLERMAFESNRVALEAFRRGSSL